MDKKKLTMGLMLICAAGWLPNVKAADPQGTRLPLFDEAVGWILKCPAWLSEMDEEALIDKRGELFKTWELTATPEQKQADKAITDQRSAVVKKESCDGAVGSRVRESLSRLAFESNAELTSRAASLASAKGARAMSGLTDLANHKALFEKIIRSYDEQMAKGGMADGWKQMKEKHAREAESVLALACNQREKTGKGNYPCRPMKEPLGTNAIYADAILESAEAFANAYQQVYKKASDPGGTLPVNNYQKIVLADNNKKSDSDYDASCPNGTLVINAQEEAPPSAIKVDGFRNWRLLRLGERKPVGVIQTMFIKDLLGINMFGIVPGAYSLMEGHPALSAIGINSGSDTEIKFIPCREGTGKSSRTDKQESKPAAAPQARTAKSPAAKSAGQCEDIWWSSITKGTDASGLFDVCKKEAEQGDGVAQFYLAQLYDNGEDGAPKDAAKAFHWYEKSAQQGVDTAQLWVGHAYKNGKGVTQDYAKALMWYERSAKQGLPVAQNFAGVMYALGKGTPKNLVKAYMWLDLATSSGFKDAASPLAEAAGMMTPSQIEEAKKLEKAFQPKSEHE